MSDGRAVTIVAVDGGYIVEYNEIVKVTKTLPIKDEQGNSVKTQLFDSGKRQVAVRSSVEEVMKLMAGLLILRMEVKTAEKAIFEKHGALAYDQGDMKAAAEGPMAVPSDPSPSYAQKA